MSAVFGVRSDLLQAVRHDLHRPHPFGTPMGTETDIRKYQAETGLWPPMEASSALDLLALL
jgi:hypothetical protein